MLTRTEIENIIKQVNVNFDTDRQRIKALEDAVKALQEAKVPAKKASKDE